MRQTRPDIDLCMESLKDEFEGIRQSPDINDWLPTGCCYFSKFMKCFDKNVKNYCAEDGIKYLHWCRDAYLGDMVELICPKDSDSHSQKCINLMGKISELEANGTRGEKAKSVLLPVYKMFQDYENGGKTGLF